MQQLVAIALGVLGLAAATQAQSSGISLFQGTPGSTGSVLVFDPQHVHAPPLAPAELQGIRILPLDFAGRVSIDALRTDKPRLRSDVPQAARIELPFGRGSLYHYARSAGGVTAWGYFTIGADGIARSVYERVDALAASDPFVGRVAIAPDGTALLAATTLAAGGDLYEIDIASGAAQARTSALPPLDFGGAGLALAGTWGVAAHATGVLRFQRVASGDASAVSFAGGTPAWFARELVLSTSGTRAATIAGAGPTAADVFALASTGPATRVTTQPAALSGAGFEPDALDGPYLAISDDGTTCAWRREGVKREAFLAHVQPQPGEQPEQLTSDARFDDTLDEVGIYFFRALSHTLTMAVGKQNAPGTNEIENLDIYQVDLPAGAAPQFTNVSLSSGDPTVPFGPASSLKPELMRWVPAADALLFLDRDTNRLVAVRPSASGVQVLLNDMKSLDMVELVAGQIVLGARSEIQPKPEQLWRVGESLTQLPQLVMTFGSSDPLERPALRADGWIGFVETTPSAEFVWRYNVLTGALARLTPRPLFYGPAQTFAPTGEQFLGVGQAGNPAIFALWPTTGLPKRLPLATAPGFVLPGA